MQICGIVSEYNPFHMGHVHHILETRRMLGRDCGIVAVMSGNFVQRGDFAVMAKQQRALSALNRGDGAGVDLVVELPLIYSLSSAEGFAQAAIGLMNDMAVLSHVSFGSETGELAPLRELAAALLDPNFDELLKNELKSGVSYAAARQRTLEKLSPRYGDIITKPNNILAVEYLKALQKSGSALEPLTLRRQGAGHDQKGAEGQFPSASQIRELLLAGKKIPKGYMPETALGTLEKQRQAGAAPACWSNCERAVIAALRKMSDEEFGCCDRSGEGLTQGVMAAARKEATLEGIVTTTKTKRYARARIMRMLMRAYLGITDGPYPPVPYIRALAFNKTGQSILKGMNKEARAPVIVKPAHVQKLGGFARELMELEARSTDLYQLSLPDFSPKPGGSEWQENVVRI